MSGEGSWNPWKLTAIGLALVMVTALVTGMVVASWSGRDDDRQALESAPAPAPAPAKAVAPQQPAASPRLAAAPAPKAPAAPAAPTRPTASVIEECNRVASQPTTKDKTVEVVKDAAIAAVVGAAVGAAGGAIADGGKGAGKGAAIGGVVGAGAGTLYGLNENRKSDERAREAYAACMRARGY
jgi:hypothetical protein